MKMKPIAIAAISGLVIALAGMPAMADDNTSTGQSAQGSASDNTQSATDNSQSQNNAGSSDSTSTGSANSDEGNPDTPSGDDY